MRDKSVWDERLAKALADAAVARKFGMFAHFRDLGRDDLEQEALTAIHRAFPTFDPDKASFSTWASMVAGRRLIDIYRTRARQAGREGVYASLTPSEQESPIDALLTGLDSPGDVFPLDVAEWLRSIYYQAKRMLTAPRHRRGRRYFSPGQAMAAAFLMEREGLTTRGAVEFFRARPELAEAIRFRHVPSHYWFWQAQELLTEILENFSGPQKAAVRRLLEHPLRTERITV